METMIKDSRHEIFASSTKEAERLYKAKTPNFYCSNPTAQSPQLLNRQKTSNSFKNISSAEPVELETNDLYHFKSKKNERLNLNSPLLKKEHSIHNDSYRESDFTNDNDDTTGKSEKKLTFQNDKLKSQQNIAKLKNNANSTSKIVKSKSDITSNSLLNNFGSSSLIATKIQCDKNAKKKAKKNKEKKEKKEKKHNSAANIQNSENSLMGDMFRTNEQNNNKLNLKMRKEPTTQFKPIIKKTYSLSNNAKADKPISPEIENLDTLRWRYEVDDPVEEEKRLDLYKQNRRRRYIEQRNKQILLTNGSTNFLPYLYYENVEKPPTPKPLPVEEDNLADNLTNTDPMLETTLTVDPELNNLNNRASSAGSAQIIIESSNEEKDKLTKEARSNVTTDSAISSLSSSSR